MFARTFCKLWCDSYFGAHLIVIMIFGHRHDRRCGTPELFSMCVGVYVCILLGIAHVMCMMPCGTWFRYMFGADGCHYMTCGCMHVYPQTFVLCLLYNSTHIAPIGDVIRRRACHGAHAPMHTKTWLLSTFYSPQPPRTFLRRLVKCSTTHNVTHIAQR